VNHSVQVFMSGCLTLKFSGSWKTVRISPSFAALLLDDCSPSAELSVGEMGIVSSGTCWLLFGAAATSAIVSDVTFCVVGLDEG
jgi:hypothetical protein